HLFNFSLPSAAGIGTFSSFLPSSSFPGIRKYPESRRSVNPTSPQLIRTLWTNGSARDFFSRRPSHLRRNAHKKRLRAKLGPCYYSPVQLGGPEDGLYQARNPSSWPAFPDPTGLERRPISTSEGPQSLLGYYPPGPEHGGYGWWPVGPTEQERGPQPGPNFNSHAPHHTGWESWPISSSLEGGRCLPRYYDGRSHDPFRAAYDATLINGQEYPPQPNAGYSSVPDSRALHRVEQGVQCYSDPDVSPFQDDWLTSFAPQGSRAHPNGPPSFPQDVGEASGPLSPVEQEQGLQPHHYSQAAQGPDDDSWVMGLPERARWLPFHPRRDLPAHHNVRSGPWSTGGGEGDPGFPSHAEDVS
ncbi:uncharacterized protein LOC113430201, partial [Notechis scutatus]|uniref:Uncharacterized protein LOC113430201 n=1 Tax=Notechis scutatus TaxID=8663 RepID=A0A6J1W7R6_9SAUR